MAEIAPVVGWPVPVPMAHRGSSKKHKNKSLNHLILYLMSFFVLSKRPSHSGSGALLLLEKCKKMLIFILEKCKILDKNKLEKCNFSCFIMALNSRWE